MAQQRLALPRLSLRAATGRMATAANTYQVSNLSVDLQPDRSVRVQGTGGNMMSTRDPKVGLDFVTDDGWTVSAPDCFITSSSTSVEHAVQTITWTVQAKELTVSRGSIEDADIVTLYKVITSFAFQGNGLEETAARVTLPHALTVLHPLVQRIYDRFQDERLAPSRRTLTTGQRALIYVPGIGMRVNSQRHRVMFKTPALRPLTLVKDDVDGIPDATGYFVLQDTLAAVDTTWDDTFNHLYWLLSLAASHLIGFPVTYIEGPRGSRIQLHGAQRELIGGGQSLIPIGWPYAVSRFLDSTFDQYVSLHSRIDLKKLIEYYIAMQGTGTIEIQYLLGSVFMEGLKYSYAHTYKNYERAKDGRFKQTDGSRYTFAVLMAEIYKEFGITQGPLDFVVYRDEVVHEGRFTSPFPLMLEKTTQLKEVIEHLLLRMLHYDGEYYDRKRRRLVEFKSLTT